MYDVLHFPSPDDYSNADQRAELSLLFHCEFNLDNEPDRVAFRDHIGCSEGEYSHLCQKYSRVLEKYRKENLL
jgi:hypothetical protein